MKIKQGRLIIPIGTVTNTKTSNHWAHWLWIEPAGGHKNASE